MAAARGTGDPVTAADYPDWGAPQANASAIAVTGVPLLVASTPLVTAVDAINAGANYASGYIPVEQPSYEATIYIGETGSGAAGPVQVVMSWWNAAATELATQETYYIWPGAGGSNHAIFGKGPSKSNLLQVTVANTSAAMQYTMTLFVYQRSHVYTRDDWRSVNYTQSASGNAIATCDPTAGLLGTNIPSIAAAATSTFELPLYAGPAYLYFDTTSATSDLLVTLTSSAGTDGLGVGARLQRYQSGALGTFAGQIALPRFQTRLLITNKNAGLQTAFFSLYTIDQSA
jgi:hypothetical protein